MSMTTEALADRWLPLNRKERYYTATVLPGIICADSFEHIDRFWHLIELDVPVVSVLPGNTNIQLFTEYSLAESIYTSKDKARLRTGDYGLDSNDTPDLVFLIEGAEPVLIAIEAKLFSLVRAEALNDQLGRQWDSILRPLLSLWTNLKVAHVVLLPKEMGIVRGDIQGADQRHDQSLRLMSWEDIRDNFADIPSARYFHEILMVALKRYQCLRSTSTAFTNVGRNKDDNLTGQEIVDLHDSGTLPFRSMGRLRGLNGAKLRNDIDTGAWRQFPYEVSTKTDVNRNWFAIESFVAALRTRGVEK